MRWVDPDSIQIYGTVPSMGLQVLKQPCQTAGVVFNVCKIFAINKLWLLLYYTVAIVNWDYSGIVFALAILVNNKMLVIS